MKLLLEEAQARQRAGLSMKDVEVTDSIDEARGNWGHAGRKGQWGGSASSSGGGAGGGGHLRHSSKPAVPTTTLTFGAGDEWAAADHGSYRVVEAGPAGGHRLLYRAGHNNVNPPENLGTFGSQEEAHAAAQVHNMQQLAATGGGSASGGEFVFTQQGRENKARELQRKAEAERKLKKIGIEKK